MPAERPLAEAVLCTGDVFQAKVYGAVPPFAVAEALPVEAPWQPTCVCPLMLALNAAAGCVMVAVVVLWQPFASVTVTWWLPAASPVAVAPVCTGLVFQA